MDKERLDKLVLERGLAASREEARAMILAGEVAVDGAAATKPGTRYPLECSIEVAAPKRKYVSRGGHKLEKGLEVFRIDVKNRVAMDVGSSTGGFTDCLLQRGARRVYAVDVGRGQLAWSLRCDERVRVMERTNFRYLERTSIDDSLDIITVDISFISLAKVSDKLREFSSESTDIVVLIKPQFEAGPERVGKRGVVKDRQTHADTVLSVLDSMTKSDLAPIAITHSPITGPEGNIEFLAHLRPMEAARTVIGVSEVHLCVATAHSDLLCAEER